MNGTIWKRLGVLLAVCLVLTGVLVYSGLRREPYKVSGFIEADEIRVGSRVGGRVQAVQAVEGSRVKVGDKLVELEPFDLMEQRAELAAVVAQKQAEFDKVTAGYRPQEIAQAQARVAQLQAKLDELVAGPRRQEIAAAQAIVEEAQARVELAQITYQRTKAIFETSAAAREELDRATESLTASRANLKARQEQLNLLEAGTRVEAIRQAQAQIEESRQAHELLKSGYRAEEVQQAKAALDAAKAALAGIQQQIDELVIAAPVDGVIEAVDLQPGDLVAPNAPVLSMLSADHLWVRAYVPENRLDIKIGQKVLLSVDSFPERRFASHVSFIARQAEFTPGNVQTPEERSKQVFRIKVTLDEGLDVLRSGMSADVWLPEPPS